MNKILNILNLKLDRNQVYIFLSMFVCGLLSTYIFPVIIKDIYSKLPSSWIAFESLVGSVSGLLISVAWKNSIRHGAIKRFMGLVIAETICGVVLCAYLLFIDYNIWVLAVSQLVYTTFVTSFVGKCIMVFKSKLWNNERREHYDNNASIIAGLTCILGYSLAMFFEPSIKFALALWGIAYLVDDIGWAIVFWKNREQLTDIKEDE
jgi:MFS family permease